VKRFLMQTAIFIMIGVALLAVYGIIRSQSLAAYPNAQRSAAGLLSLAVALCLPAVVVATISTIWKRLQWSTIAGAVVVPLVIAAALIAVATPDLEMMLSFCAIGAVAAAASHWLSKEILKAR